MIKLHQSTLLVCLLIASLLNTPLSLANPAAIKAFEKNNLTIAKTLFEENIKKDPKDFVSLDYLANIALAQSEFDDAEEYIEKALKYATNDAKIQFNAGRIMGALAQDASIFSAMGYAKKSLQGFKKATILEPQNIKYRQALMSFYLRAPGIAGGDLKLAEAEANAIVALDAAEGYIAMANFYHSTDEEKLKAHYDQLDISFAENPAVIMNRAMYYQSKELFDQAFADLNRVLAIKPIDETDRTQFSALYQFGKTSLLSNKNIDEGIKSFQLFIDTSPELDSLPTKAWAKYRLGLLYLAKGDKKTAKDLYQQAQNETQDESLISNVKKSLKKV